MVGWLVGRRAHATVRGQSWFGWFCCDLEKSQLIQPNQVCPRTHIGFVFDSRNKSAIRGFYNIFVWLVGWLGVARARRFVDNIGLVGFAVI